MAPDGADWHDPFSEDEKALERERRRAEREARRRGTQASLGEKVASHRDGAGPAATPAPPAGGPADAAAASPATGEVAAVSPATGESAALDPATGESALHPSTAELRAQHPPAEPGVHRHRTGDHPAVAPDPGFEWTDGPRTRGAAAPPPGGVSHRELLVRRIVGIGFVIALVAILGIGASKVLDKLGGEEQPVQKAAPLKVEELAIPEGLDRRQIAEIAKDAGLKGDYEKAANKAPKGFDLAKYGAADAPNLEGFLFPATYELEKNTKVEDLVDKQLEAFKANLAEVDLSYAESKNLTVYDVLKIASMIEREIQVPEERKKAAAVIYNRLAAGDTLGIDATIRYEDQNYDEQLLESRLSEPTPYNTRVNPGLPPTPIGNPGLASIEAAADPARSDVYYFVVKPGTCGEHVFVETAEEFAAAEAEYQQALQEQGGSPTDC